MRPIRGQSDPHDHKESDFGLLAASEDVSGRQVNSAEYGPIRDPDFPEAPLDNQVILSEDVSRAGSALKSSYRASLNINPWFHRTERRLPIWFLRELCGENGRESPKRRSRRASISTRLGLLGEVEK